MDQNKIKTQNRVPEFGKKCAIIDCSLKGSNKRIVIRKMYLFVEDCQYKMKKFNLFMYYFFQ